MNETFNDFHVRLLIVCVQQTLLELVRRQVLKMGVCEFVIFFLGRRRNYGASLEAAYFCGGTQARGLRTQTATVISIHYQRIRNYNQSLPLIEGPEAVGPRAV